MIGQRPEGKFTPVVLVPGASTPSCCCIPCCWVSIPSGFSAIVSKFGAVIDGDEPDGTFSPGCHFPFNPMNTVDKLVSRQLIVFDTPVKDVKSQDSINVSIDVLMVFEVEKARDFVYEGGAEKFDDWLRAAQAEVLRQIVNETPIDQVYDLHGARSDNDQIVAELNEKAARYGVKIHHFTIQDIQMPQNLANDKEEQTLYKKREYESIVKQKAEVQRISVEEGKSKLKEECDNNKMVAEQQAEVAKTQATRETKQVIAQTEKDIAELEANQTSLAQQVKSQADLECSKIESQIKTIEREYKAKTQAESGKMKAEALAYEKAQESQAKIEVAEKMANGKRAMGEAEGEAAYSFAARRAYDAEMKRLDILEKLVGNKDVKIATSQENATSLNDDNAVVSQMAQQGVEAIRAKLAEITATSLAKLERQPRQALMD